MCLKAESVLTASEFQSTSSSSLSSLLIFWYCRRFLQCANIYVETPQGRFKNSMSYRKVTVCCMLSCFCRVWLFATPWTAACQAPLSMGFLRQEYWSGLPRSPTGDLHNPGIEPCLFPAQYWEVGSLPLVPPGKPRKGLRAS